MKKHFFFILFSFSIVMNNKSNAQIIDRIEPPFWWNGMKNNFLQLLIHGENISSYEIEIKSDAVKKYETRKVENPNYLFVDIILAPSNTEKNFDILFKSNKKTKFKYKYLLKTRNQQKRGFSSADFIYLLMPDRFANGNPDNDSHPQMLEKPDRNNPDGRHGGDLQGIIQHLDYIQSTGCTALWINPFQENNMPAYSYHGYAITDFYKTDPRLGTNQLYKTLVDSLHKRNMKIIMDIVFNHCGKNHWWINDLPEKNWIHNFERFTRSNYRASTLPDIHASQADRNLMVKGWFDTSMPDLNLENEFLQNYFIQMSIWWIEYAGLDGIRLDTQPYPEKEFIAKWSRRIFDEYPDFTVVGEAWLQKPAFTAYFQKDSYTPDGYNSGIPVVTDFPLYFALSSAFNESDGWTQGLARLYYVFAHDYLYGNPYNLLIFADNHDLSRLFSTLGKDIRKFKMAMALILTARGIPMMYYGTEILNTGFERQGHGHIRTDFPGGWPNDTINCFEPKGRTKMQNEAFDFIKNLAQWRKTSDAIINGKMTHFVPENNIYVYFRYTENDCVMVIFNNNDKETKNIDTKRYNEFLHKYDKAYDVIENKELEGLNKIVIKPKSVRILQLK